MKKTKAKTVISPLLVKTFLSKELAEVYKLAHSVARRARSQIDKTNAATLRIERLFKELDLQESIIAERKKKTRATKKREH